MATRGYKVQTTVDLKTKRDIELFMNAINANEADALRVIIKDFFESKNKEIECAIAEIYGRYING